MDTMCYAAARMPALLFSHVVFRSAVADGEGCHRLPLRQDHSHRLLGTATWLAVIRIINQGRVFAAYPYFRWRLLGEGPQESATLL